MLGYTDAACALSNSQYGIASHSVPIWMSNLGCNGREKYLDVCPFYGWGPDNHYCRSHYDDAGVVCINGKDVKSFWSLVMLVTLILTCFVCFIFIISILFVCFVYSYYATFKWVYIPLTHDIKNGIMFSFVAQRNCVAYTQLQEHL